MKNNVKPFLLEMAELMKKHEIEFYIEEESQKIIYNFNIVLRFKNIENDYNSTSLLFIGGEKFPINGELLKSRV